MTTEVKKDHKYIHFAITLAIMLFFRFIPPIGGITPYGMAKSSVFLLA